MKLTEIKNEQGELSGIIIPATDFSEIKGDLKKGSKFYHYFDDLSNTAKKSSTDEIILSGGRTIGEINRNMQSLAEDVYRQAFALGEPMYYRDERSKNANEYVKANPDGSEDLVLARFEDDNDKIVQHLANAGKGKYAHLIPSSSLNNETSILSAGGAKRGR